MNIRAALILPLLLATAACGWHAGLHVPQGTRIGVEVFETDREILERGLEPLLTEEISRALIDRLGAPIECPERADLVVRGRILDYRRRPGIRNKENQLLETGLFVRASAELVERRTGNVVVPVKEAQVWSGYSTDRSLESEEAARQRALRHVADSLVLDLFRPGAARVPSAPGAQDGSLDDSGAR
jgi:hypothetical protein